MALTFMDRRKTDCSKWDGLESVFGQGDLQAMWVADMDFRCPQCVIDRLQDFVDFGVFGYYHPPETYPDAFLAWEKQYHGYSPKREWLRFSPGVVPAINWLIRILTEPGDSVIVLTPVYYPFLNAIRDNGRRLVCCDLINNNGVYSVDFEDFERQITEQKVRMFILSSPHNPVGRVWSRQELQTMLEICRKHGVYVLSDEIHQDFVSPGYVHTPSALTGDYDDMLITLTAATKTFNLAGCQNSFIIIPSFEIREQFDRFTAGIQVQSGNPFGYIAVEAAYRDGRPWLEEVKAVIQANRRFVETSFAENCPQVIISPLEGTYLLWMDFGAMLKAEEMKPFMQEKCSLAFDYGDWFGGKRFATHIRMNLATSEEMVQEAVSRILRNMKNRSQN